VCCSPLAFGTYIHTFDEQTADHYAKIKAKIDNAWHEQGWSRWTNDPAGKLRRSTEVCAPAPLRHVCFDRRWITQTHSPHPSLRTTPLHIVRLVCVHGERSEAGGSQEAEEALQAESIWTITCMS